MRVLFNQPAVLAGMVGPLGGSLREAVERLGEFESEGPFADRARSRYEIGVRHSVGGHCPAQPRQGVRMSDQAHIPVSGGGWTRSSFSITCTPSICRNTCSTASRSSSVMTSP